MQCTSQPGLRDKAALCVCIVASHQVKPQDERAAHDAPGTKVRLMPLEADPLREIAYLEPEMCDR